MLSCIRAEVRRATTVSPTMNTSTGTASSRADGSGENSSAASIGSSATAPKAKNIGSQLA